MTTIRNFDALNDVDNLIDSGNSIHNAGLKHEVTVTMMSLPPNTTGAHDPAFYEKTLRNILDAGIPFDSICFKDASGTSTPRTVYETVKRARKLVGDKVKIVMHSHDTAGCCVAQYMAALDAGANQVDLSMQPVSGGTCQVDIVTMQCSRSPAEHARLTSSQCGTPSEAQTMTSESTSMPSRRQRTSSSSA